MTPEQTMSVAEAASRAGVHPRTMRRWVAEGIINGYRLGPRMLRISAADVDELLAPVAP
ncbi:helix-turn-helix domain-containing protein [Mycolicibacterium sp. S2-37]|uniref:helix-turn-helix domain-containing protein n=1 Tax=Mycolicibacterium sp. S2-37 TaxID=2810297 RepID=UPI001A93D43C|nr:helix-turn-helix domain-containing protein [Mycolicibacterium sp. S2-37]MBO0677193.1 helix-turn-helix domain-containing protein [Mycolicibacterium sp. S2-37]